MYTTKIGKVVLSKVGHLAQVPFYLPWLFLFWVSGEKLVTSQLYKNDKFIL
jgi:hypothetical protein